ncbi:hypothetical protein ACFQ8S_21360 [Streptomyces virginiae]|uniref:hypothetical protein n=1 Tax=Streptomyces virginiae TaxID=1961 RepID=UPI00369BA170
MRRIIFNDEEIGMGFNSQSGLAVGTALDGFTIQGNSTATGQQVTSSIAIINSHEELQESIGMGFEAQGRYGTFSATAKAKFSAETNFNSTSTFLLAQVVVQNPLTRGQAFKVTATAKELLNASKFDEFTRAFGDSFIRGLQTGGEFYAVIRITSVSTSTQSDLVATLHAEANGLVASGSFKAAFSQANKSSSSRAEHTAIMYQNAGSGVQISPIVEIGEVITRFKKFPEFAKSNPAAYEAEVATYDTLPLPVPTAEEQEAFLLALADARERKLRYIQARNDLQFALQNPAFFDDLPSPDAMVSISSVYTRLINAVMDHAIKLSRGQISPPRLFDPGMLSPPIVEPAPLVLKRALPSAPQSIPVVHLAGQSYENYYLCQQIFAGEPSGTIAEWLHRAEVASTEGGLIYPDEPYPTNSQINFLLSAVSFRFSPDPDSLVDGEHEVVITDQYPRDGLVSAGSEVVLQVGYR